MEEVNFHKEGVERRESRAERASSFFEDHGLRLPEKAMHETRGIGFLAMERDALNASKQHNDASKEAALAGKGEKSEKLQLEAEEKYKEAKWTQNMGAINFNEPVERKTIEPGTVLYRYEMVQAKGGEGGAAAAGLRWFCSADSSPRNLGMVPDGAMETGGNRFVLPDGTRWERKGFVATRPVEALESTASDLCGFREDDRGLLYFGGGRQICVADRSALKPIEGMSLDEEIRLRLGQNKYSDGK
jgi:hypothetical protein